ncbi:MULTISPECIES: hypothetical protein [Silvimonas]|uniref:hypothetical protein n=1 Tax=Silvimonas TaxID=300264 RepID=UPI0024B39ED8|nr:MULTISPECIES: hypothetical protein [Silvimonas]MDR3429344.1 hypothetical protein [Silvimonas sp.]
MLNQLLTQTRQHAALLGTGLPNHPPMALIAWVRLGVNKTRNDGWCRRHYDEPLKPHIRRVAQR